MTMRLSGTVMEIHRYSASNVGRTDVDTERKKKERKKKKGKEKKKGKKKENKKGKWKGKRKRKGKRLSLIHI